MVKAVAPRAKKPTTKAKAAPRPKPPAEAVLLRPLGPARPAFEVLVSRGPGTTREWRQYRADGPWVLKLYQGKRTLFYAQPEAGQLKVTVLLGEKATAAALSGRVSESLHEAIRAARAYPEGRPVPLVVKTLADAALVEELLAVKLDPR